MINYILLPVFVLFVIGYKIRNKTRLVKLEEMDIWSGRREIQDFDNTESLKPKKWWSLIYSIVIG